MAEPEAALAAAVEQTVAGLGLGDSRSDAALVHLAGLYAEHIDGAGEAAERADRALRLAEAEGDEMLGQLVAALRAKLTERETLDRLGARLHAALVELGATPRARAAKSGTPGGAAPSTLDAFRRQHGVPA